MIHYKFAKFLAKKREHGIILTKFHKLRPKFRGSGKCSAALACLHLEIRSPLYPYLHMIRKASSANIANQQLPQKQITKNNTLRKSIQNSSKRSNIKKPHRSSHNSTEHVIVHICRSNQCKSLVNRFSHHTKNKGAHYEQCKYADILK